MRPSIVSLLGVDKAVHYFSLFCKAALIGESLDCILDINHFFDEENSFYRSRKLSSIIDLYMNTSSVKMVNIPHNLRNAMQKLGDDVEQVLMEIKAELMLMLEYRIPHFTLSKYWNEFVCTYPHLIKYCISETMSERFRAIRFKKEDFMRDTFTKREDELCELLKTDMDLFQLKQTEVEGSLAIYLFDGDSILDEEDIGLGKFQGFKVSGILPYPQWLVMMCIASTTFHNRIWGGCLFDCDSDYNYISHVEGENYDSHICKLILDYGRFLEYRSCYVLTGNLYKDNTTYLMTRSIQPHDDKYIPNVMLNSLMEPHDMKDEVRNHTHKSDPTIKISKKTGRKKCVYLPNLSLFSAQSIGDTSTAFNFINLLNPGGVLLSKIGTPEKRMMKIAKTYRSNIVREIDLIIKNGEFKHMESIYNMVKSKLDIYKKTSQSVKSHIFERSFGEAILDIP
jgi:hypothetical protein